MYGACTEMVRSKYGADMEIIRTSHGESTEKGENQSPPHIVFTEQSRIIFFHILMDKRENSLPEPARLVGYLILIKITIHNPLLFLAEQAHHALFAFRFFGRCFHTRFVSLSHISCKNTLTSVKTKQKKLNFTLKRSS